MYAYLKTRTAFRTSFLREAVDYSLVLDALEAASSSLRLRGGDIPREAGGSFAILHSTVFLVSLVSPGAGYTDLQLSSPLELFSRPRPYTPPPSGSSVGAFIARELAAGWRDEPDSAYAMPYLQIDYTDQTPFVPPEVDANGLFVLSTYLRTVRASLGVETLLEPQGDVLRCTIRKTAPRSHTFLCGDGHTFLDANTYSRTAVAKVSTYQPVDTGEVDENGEKIFRVDRTDWYLGSDGTVAPQEPAGRALGEWETVTVSEKKSAQEAAEAVFARNTETHKVTFYTDTRPRPRDELRLRLPSGEVFEGQVSAVSCRKGDGRWIIQVGTLATSLTDKVRRASVGRAGSARGSSAAAAQIYAVGDLYLTTRAGDPADLLGYGAWDRIQGRFLFAADSSRPVGARGGAATHTISSQELPSDVSILDTSGVHARTQGAPAGSAQYAVLSSTLALKTMPLGDGESFSLLPPYISIYVWIRKA